MKGSHSCNRIKQRQISMALPSSSDSWDQQRSSHHSQRERTSCQSDSVDNGVQGRALLEEWSRPANFVDQDDVRISSSTPRKVVSFSPHSRLHVYLVDDDERLKSFSSSEQKLFQAHTLYNAVRIQELIQSCPYKRGNAIRYLIGCNLICPEELLGIEHLIVGAAKTSKERRIHSRLVVEKQEELHRSNQVNIEQKLADVAAATSLKSSEKARVRAALAA